MTDRDDRRICERLGAEQLIPEAGSKLGLALITLGRMPIRGDRCPPENGTNGWYIWCGDQWSDDPNFYAPLHVEHLEEMLPLVLRYLDLPPGYRFIIDDKGYEDVWFDEALLRTDA
jgi:hypothetical protein